METIEGEAPIERRDSGIRALCGIAAFYRIAADPKHLEKELALHDRAADERDLVRAARMVGLKARIIDGLTAKRIATIPAPAIVRLNDGSFHVFGGRNPSGNYRLVDPITRTDRDLPLDELLHILGPQLVLVGRRMSGESTFNASR